MTKEDVLALSTNDFQHRKGNYPKANIADSLEVRYNEQDKTFAFIATFKNTSEHNAEYWLETYIEKLDVKFTIKHMESWQDGDYQDDWVMAECIVNLEVE